MTDLGRDVSSAAEADAVHRALVRLLERSLAKARSRSRGGEGGGERSSRIPQSTVQALLEKHSKLLQDTRQPPPPTTAGREAQPPPSRSPERTGRASYATTPSQLSGHPTTAVPSTPQQRSAASSRLSPALEEKLRDVLAQAGLELGVKPATSGGTPDVTRRCRSETPRDFSPYTDEEWHWVRRAQQLADSSASPAASTPSPPAFASIAVSTARTGVRPPSAPRPRSAARHRSLGARGPDGVSAEVEAVLRLRDAEARAVR